MSITFLKKEKIRRNFTTNFKRNIITDSNLDSALKLLFYQYNNLLLRIYYKSVVKNIMDLAFLSFFSCFSFDKKLVFYLLANIST